MSNVSISVARMLIFLTKPSTSPTVTKSPALIGRSNKRMIPETKLFAIDCSQNPIPTESAPATTAKPVTLIPAIDKPISKEIVKPV